MYREPVPPTFEPLTSFNKGPVAMIRRQVRFLLIPTVLVGLAGLFGLVFILAIGGPVGTAIMMAVPLLGLVPLVSMLRGKIRGIDELSVAVVYSPQTRMLRFSSPDHPAVELPIADVRALAFREKELDPVQSVRSRFVRSSFAIVAETPNGDVAITQPLVCTGTGFIAAGRAHLQTLLPEVTAKITSLLPPPT